MDSCRRSGIRELLLVALVLCLAAGGCWFHRGAPNPVPTFPAAQQVAILPPSVRGDQPELRKLSLRATVIMAGIVEWAPDLEAIPFWHSIPLALNRLGASRVVSPQMASSIAELSGARWATACEFATGPYGISILLDFMPSNQTTVPFRYTGTVTASTLESVLTTAFEQFLRYLGVRPLPAQKTDTQLPLEKLEALGAVFDREYGWFVRATPGRSQQAALDLQRADPGLARVLFDPSLYAARPESKPQAAATAAESKSVPSVEPSRAAAVPVPAQLGNPTVVPEPPVTPAKVVPAVTSPPQKAVPLEDIRIPPKPALIIAGKSDSTRPAPGPPAAAPASPKPQPAGIFEIQVFATKNQQAAEDVARRILKAGFAASVISVDLADKGVWYRVRLSGFMSRATALAAGKKIVASGLVGEFWVIRP
jgi:hypothetical protein